MDPYKVLQVDPEAEDEVIQAAYRRLARKYHPDVAPGPEAAARMVALNQAWDLVGDPERRAAHDRSRTAPSDGGPGSPPGTPSGSVLTFGRYAGWTLGQVARVDLDFLEWLDRASIGRQYRDEVDALLRQAGRRRTAEVEASERRGLFRRR